MSITKNIQHLKIKENMLRDFCNFIYRERLIKIQETYRELKNKVNAIADKWVKVDGEDYFIFICDTEKVLVPDSRKMKPIYCNINSSNSVRKILTILSDSEDFRDNLKKIAEEGNANIITEFSDSMLGLNAYGISCDWVRKIFRNTNSPLMDSSNRVKLADGMSTVLFTVCDANGSCYSINTNFLESYSSYTGVQLSIHVFKESETLFAIAEKYGIFPECLNANDKKIFKELTLLCKDGVKIEDMDSLKSYLRNSNRKELLGYCFDVDKIKEEILETEIDVHSDGSNSSFLKQYLDEYDFHRAKIQKYNSRWYLSDEGKGHWDLWCMGEKAENQEKMDGETKEDASSYIIHIKNSVIARNPLADIKYDAVVGIDFGTKSTIVAVLDDNDNIIPLRVGMANYLEEPKREHYENPTVIQFIDLNTFYQNYKSSDGRPYTSWDDVKISHEAFNHMITAKQSREYAAFMSNLKQWAGGRYGKYGTGHLVIRDQKGERYDINNYEALTDEDIDPIELYAYYLGIFINNMHTGIYLDYLLSFPESFTLEVKERLLLSFHKGIKRSLPESIFYDEEASAAFRVRQGPSEPAAYAACALEQYGILPDDKGVFYGIFDFGGGTTDFDYGIWKNGSENGESYDYVIQHFYSGGDKSLGGENLLELLAYNIFSDNAIKSPEGGATNFQQVREKKIVFFKPPEGKIFPGTEALISLEENAVLNTKNLMEVIRPLWEENEVYTAWKDCKKTIEKITIQCGNNGYLVLNENGSITAHVNLFDEDGDNKIELELQVDENLMNQTLDNRIEQGVHNFFETLQLAYKKNPIESCKPIHIFLAGNASRSKRVTKLFQQYMQKYERIMFEAEDKESADSFESAEVENIDYFEMTEGEETVAELEELDEEVEILQNSSHFLLFPPLGCSEAVEIQKKMGVTPETENLMAPTGKTGVAFGMLMCRENSDIKVETERKKTEQIPFSYYIGISSRRCFKMIFDRSVEYNQWYIFKKAFDEMETFEFYYTELAEVLSGDKEIKSNPSIHRKKCLVDNAKEGTFIFFRFTGPVDFEYVVADKESIEEGDYVSSIYKISL